MTQLPSIRRRHRARLFEHKAKGAACQAACDQAAASIRHWAAVMRDDRRNHLPIILDCCENLAKSVEQGKPWEA